MDDTASNASIANVYSRRIPASPTLAMSEKASLLKKQGKDVINLSVGESDLSIPTWIQQAAVQAIEGGSHLYTPIAGLPELRQAIVDKLAQENHLMGYLPSQVVVSNGAKQVIHNAMMVSLEPTSEVLIPAPYWVSYPTMVTMAGGKPVILSCKEEQGFKLMPEQLSKAITPHTRWLVLNSPSNPSGAVYSKAELQGLAEVLLSHPHIWILSDDIYEHLVYPPAVFASIHGVEPRLMDRTLLVNGLSKCFAMTGWRLGYGVGPQSLIEAMVRFQSHSTSGASCISQWAGVTALTDPQGSHCLADQMHLFQQRRDLLVQGLSRASLAVNPPQGAFYVYANVMPLMEAKGLQSDMDLAQSLLEEVFVSCVPGTEFGLSGYLRFSYAASQSLLQEAMTRIQQWINK